jgi:uridylate kinase
MQPKYKRVLLKLSGEALAGTQGFGLNEDVLSEISDTIKKCIDNNIPVVLSITNDGRGYYKNHSVTVVGYRIYKADNKEIKMLILYDNWAFSESLLDYNKLSVLSAIYF